MKKILKNSHAYHEPMAKKPKNTGEKKLPQYKAYTLIFIKQSSPFSNFIANLREKLSAGAKRNTAANQNINTLIP